MNSLIYCGRRLASALRALPVVLLMCGASAPAFAEESSLQGAWSGPKDLVVNICTDGESRLYVCSCGIFRTFGWVDVDMTVNGDSLMLRAKDVDAPFEGCLRMESADRLTGTITMGHPGEDWYYSGRTELVRQKPPMPENLNPELEGIVRTSDYGVLSIDGYLAWEVLSKLSPKSYGYAEKEQVDKLLNAKPLAVTPDEMAGFNRVRSIQVDARGGIFSYPYFKCRFRKVGGKVFFEKTTGSQRKSGYIYQNTPKSLVFLGGWSVNNDPQTSYGSTNSVAGTVYKIGANRAIMLFPTNDNRVEIYELVR